MVFIRRVGGFIREERFSLERMRFHKRAKGVQEKEGDFLRGKVISYNMSFKKGSVCQEAWYSRRGRCYVRIESTIERCVQKVLGRVNLRRENRRLQWH